MTRAAAIGLLLPACLAALAGAGCRVNEDAFQNRIFSCDTSAAGPVCGTAEDGSAMKCYAARQIGATDFCTGTCGEIPMSLPDGEICVQGNTKLKACNPADDGTAAHPNGACDHTELGCLRTDVLTDEGVCLTLNPCKVDTDCHDPVRSVCAATFLKEVYPHKKDDLLADHLYCLQEGCQTNSTNCSPGETCLRNVIPEAAHPPDICVPNCDSNWKCPPNHFCLRKISGPANPAVCIPGLLGFECDSDIDCLVGTCFEDGGTGPGSPGQLKLCTTSCSKDDDCAKFDGQQGLFVCNPSGHCVTPDAYRGASCDSDQDCMRDLGSICARSAATDRQGTCLYPCAGDGTCPSRGGINHTCTLFMGQNGPAPICFPGYFGLNCTSDQNCVGDLTCRPGAAQTAQPPLPSICTQLCYQDQDCAADRWTAGGWCARQDNPDQPFCQRPLATNKTCNRNQMCASGVCGATTQTCQ